MRLSRFFFSVVLTVSLFAFGTAAFAQEYDPNAELPRPVNPASAIEGLSGYLIVNTDNLFLRTGDRARYSPIAILDGGTRLIVRGYNGREERPWWYVEVGGYKGWVTDEFVVVRGDLRGTPITDVDGTILSPALYIGYAAPIYDILSPAGEVICSVAGNRFYQVVAQNFSADPTYFKIRATCGGATVEGWVQAIRGILRNSGGVTIPVLES